MKWSLKILKINSRKRGASKKIRHLIDNGYVVFSWKEIFGKDPNDSPLFLKMVSEASNLSFSQLENKYKSDKNSYLIKKFAVGEKISDEGLIEFAKSPEISSKLLEFFGDSHQFIAADYWLTKDSLSNDAVGSQNYHTDPEDSVMCKIFVYFTDVGDENGPTEIISNTQVGGSAKLRPFHATKLTGKYYTNDFVENLVKEQELERFFAIGKKGNIVFLNTTGLHRGGKGSKPRLMANYVFASNFFKLKARWNNWLI